MNDDMNIAALIHPVHLVTDLVLYEFAQHLRRAGCKVHGLVQRLDIEPGVMVDLRTGQHYPLFQDLGCEAQGCTLDTGNLVSASEVLRQAQSDEAELVIVNRFGKMEAQGEGFAHEMLSLMAAGVPLMTVVRDDHLPAWREFTGGAALELEATPQGMAAWYARVRKTPGRVETAICSSAAP